MNDKKLILKKQTLVNIADAVRAKTGSIDLIRIEDLDDAVTAISSGGSSCEEWNGAYEEISSVVEITFTIDGVSYTAEEGMTWETYKGSEYDVLGLYDYIGNVASSVLSISLVYYISGAEWTDTIQNGGTYTTSYMPGGAN